MVIIALVFKELMTECLIGINFLFLSTREIDVLKEKIISDKFIPEKYAVTDIVTDEIFLTSWDINSRTPRFFTKWSNANKDLFKGDEK